MEDKKLTKKELDKIIKESADEFAREVEEEVDNMSEEESRELDRIFAIEDPTERIKELNKLYPHMDAGVCK
jgi:hypothetical protein